MSQERLPPQLSETVTPRPPLLRALMAQLISAVLVLAIAWSLEAGGAVASIHTPLTVKLLAQGVLAALIGRRFGLSPWWFPLHMVFPWAVAATLYLPVPSWVYLGVFLVLLMVFWNSAVGRVPLYLSNRKTWAALAELLPEKQDLVLADLGSGLGGTLLFLARRRPQGRFHGIESAPLPYLLSRLWLLALRIFGSGSGNVKLSYGDFWDHDLSDYDVVYSFLSPAPMRGLYEKARGEMRPGSLFISNSFTVPQIDPDQVVSVADRRDTRLYIWRM
ncbi:MAG: class I SAM-dependent methyltransferase [Alphaproteobacteria bacterium]|nr:class I SAM-dependent methyltransferase [Alphaproteobacteria bacterium]